LGAKMQKRFLGNTGLSVSQISFGTVSLGVPYGIGVKNKTDMVSQQEAIKLLQSAQEKGINFYDTARSYGNSEEIIGKAFKNKREQIVLATKCGYFLDKQGNIYPKAELKKTFEQSIAKSLKALQTDYIDLYMSHIGSRQVINNNDVMDVMLKFKQQGLAKALGISTYTYEETVDAIDNEVWDVIQLPFNLMNQEHSKLFDYAVKKGKGIVVRSVLFKGVLTDRGRNLHPALKDVEKHRQIYKPYLNKFNINLSELAVRFALSYKQVSSVLIGIDSPQYLNQALSAADCTLFDENILCDLEKTAYPNPDFLNLKTWSLKGWLN
jgi:1-deoxyxylulose-5-phosphate synthase